MLTSAASRVCQGVETGGLQQASQGLPRCSISLLALPFSMSLVAPVTVAQTNKGLSCCTMATPCAHSCRMTARPHSTRTASLQGVNQMSFP